MKPSIKFGLGLAMALVMGSAGVRAESLAIIVAKSVALENVSSEELTKIFKCEETDGPGGVKFVVYSRERSSIERVAVLKLIYHMSEPEYNRFFMQAVFTGKLQAPPRILPNAAVMKSVTSSNAGTVGYILASEADDSVKVLKVDGLLPSDPNYPLKTEK